MPDFTFIALTYNHEDYIEEHLNSIKDIIKNYGQDYVTDIIICDDCSTDNTVRVCRQWADVNKGIYNQFIIESTEKNGGTVQNILRIIPKIESENYKFLGGDDKYGLFDIYSLFSELDDCVLVTHVTGFGGKNLKNDIDITFKILIDMYKKGKISDLIEIDNYIAAPGVFIPGKYLRDTGLIKFLEPYRYIEDYPMWIYLLLKKRIRFVVEDKKYIYYRVGQGISTNPHSKKRREYIAERDYIYRKYKIKSFVVWKYINPYKYWLAIKRIIAKIDIERNYRRREYEKVEACVSKHDTK